MFSAEFRQNLITISLVVALSVGGVSQAASLGPRKQDSPKNVSNQVAKNSPPVLQEKIHNSAKDALTQKEAHLEQGRIYWREGHLVSAMNQWKKAVEVDPRLYAAWFMMGDAYADLNQDSDALNCYKVAYKLASEDKSKAEIAKKIEKFETSVDRNSCDPLWKGCGIFLNANKLLASPSESMLSRSSNLGQVAENLSEPARSSTRSAPKAEKKSDYIHSVESYQRAIESDPKNPSNYMNLAVALELLGKYEEAIKQYEEVIKIDPKDAGAMVGIGDIYSISLSDDKTALYWYAKAIQNTSDPAKKKAIADRISKFMLGPRAR